MKDKNYQQYLKDHSNPKVRMMHFIGQWVTMLYAIWATCSKNWAWLILTPFVVYPFAVSGHILFGDRGNKPSFYRMSFFQAKRCDIKMFVDIMKGKLKIW